MQPKKNPKISLESKKSLFFQIGLAITLLLVLIAFEWKSYEKNDYNLGSLNLDDMEEEIIPITRQELSHHHHHHHHLKLLRLLKMKLKSKMKLKLRILKLMKMKLSK